MSRIASQRGRGTADVGFASPGLAALAVLGGAIGLVVALVCIVALWMMGLDINGGVVGIVAGTIAGVGSALLGATGGSD